MGEIGEVADAGSMASDELRRDAEGGDVVDVVGVVVVVVSGEMSTEWGSFGV
jgi:hypothetical protein